MADCARNSRTHPQRTALPATNGDYPVARHAIVRTLHRGAATLRCRLRLEGRAPESPFLPTSQELRPPTLLPMHRRGPEFDESKPVALRAPGSWRESRRL